MIELEKSVEMIPETLSSWSLELSPEGTQLTYTYDTYSAPTGIAELLRAVDRSGVLLKDVRTSQSSLEEIFINLVHK